MTRPCRRRIEFVLHQYEEYGEENDALEASLVKLARMPRQLRRIGREHHRPRCVGRPSIELGVHEVGEPSQEEADRHRGGDDVAKSEERNLAAAREQDQRDDDAGTAAVERHAALPELQDRERVREVLAGLIEQHIAEPPAEDDGDNRPHEEVVELERGCGGRRLLGEPDAVAPSDQEVRRCTPARTSATRTAPASSRTGRTRECEKEAQGRYWGRSA